MKNRSRALKFSLPVLILAAGFIGMVSLVLSKTPPQKMERPQVGTLVETLVLKTDVHQIHVHATGTVQSAQRVNIVPQVSGRVVRLAPNFKEGSFFNQGQLLFEIEAADYQLAVEQSRAEIANAEYNLASVESQARVARIEWERVQLSDKAQPNPLVLYEPQVKNAKAALASARANLRQRLLDLERTKIYAPFNSRVSSKSVDVGQFVTAGQTVAAVTGTDAVEIVVPVPLDELQWIAVPRSLHQKGSMARVSLNVDGKQQWQGYIDRSLGEVDVQSRMIRIVVVVDDPYGLNQTTDNRLDLAEGLFVHVILEGKTLENVWAVPASALRHQETLWLMSDDQTLNIVPVQVLRREKDIVLVKGKMMDRQALVTTPISGAAQGMILRLAQEVRS